jgi:hypothetical protein
MTVEARVRATRLARIDDAPAGVIYAVVGQTVAVVIERG